MKQIQISFNNKQKNQAGGSLLAKNRRPQAVQFFCVPSSDFCRTDSSNKKISFNLLIRWLFSNLTPFVMPAERHLRITWIFVTFGSSHIECFWWPNLPEDPINYSYLTKSLWSQCPSKEGEKKTDFSKLSLGEVKFRYFIM